MHTLGHSAQWQTLGSATARCQWIALVILQRQFQREQMLLASKPAQRLQHRPQFLTSAAASLTGYQSSGSHIEGELPKRTDTKTERGLSQATAARDARAEIATTTTAATNSGLRQLTLQLLSNAPSNPHLVSIRFTGE
jgi:hypothetical protein